jgi:hypothetical protein
MDVKRLLTGSVVGGVVITIVGFPLFTIVFGGFFEAQMIVAARQPPIYWAAIASSLVYGALITLVIGWAGARTAVEGLKLGALVGALVWLGADLILYGIYEYATLTGALADAILSAVPFGAAGAAVSAVTTKGGKPGVTAA